MANTKLQVLLKNETPYILGVVGLICFIYAWREATARPAARRTKKRGS